MRISLTSLTHFVERHVLVFGIGVSALVLIIGGFLFVAPRVKEVRALGGLDYTQKQAQLAAQQSYLEQLRGLRDEVNAVSPDDIARLNAIVPRGRDVPGIFRQMQAFAKDANMDLSSVAVSDGGSAAGSASVGGLRTVTVSVILSGALDYNGLKNFLNVVSRQAPLLDLTSISHSPSSSSQPNSYSFSFRSYYFES
ncbi:MAG: hypothetical protein AAB515_01145 [Patescibacteria group bacterium]